MTDLPSALRRALLRWRRRLLVFPLLLLAHASLFLLSAPGSSSRSQASKPPRMAAPMLLLLKPRKPAAPTPKPRVPRAVPIELPDRLRIGAVVEPVAESALSAPQPPAQTSAAASTQAPATTGSAEAPGTADAGTGRAPLVISLPRSGRPGEFSPSYNPAAHDPRSNSIRLTFSEKMALATGNAECFLEERNPDGSIWRGPGRLVSRSSASALTGAAASAGGRVEVCVR